MRRFSQALALLATLALTACGSGITLPKSNVTARQALTGPAEMVEFESVAIRQELFVDLARTSLLEAGKPGRDAVLFPIMQGDQAVAAPGIDPSMDLLQAPDAGQGLHLVFDSRGGERWAEDRRDSLQGLSEREVVEMVARTLLAHWGLRPAGAVQVDRVSGAPYAVAYVDGILMVNPSFLYMAVAPTSLLAANQ